MEIIEINDSNFKEKVSSADKVVVDCYAAWCGPCRMLEPIIEDLAEELNDVKFYKINVDENEKVVENYSISSIPLVLIFEKGEIKNKSLGLKTKEELKEKI